MGPMTGGGRGWCNPYSPLHAGYGPYLAAYPYPRRAYGPAAAGYAPVAGWPAWGYSMGRPPWGLRGFWGRGIGWAGRGGRRGW